MTNKEYYKEQILDLVCDKLVFGVSKNTHMPCACDKLTCKNCLLNSDALNCVKAFSKWCREEYAEPCPFEKGELVEVSDDYRNWRLRYFEYKQNGGYYCCSNEDGDLYFYEICNKYGTLGNNKSKENA